MSAKCLEKPVEERFFLRFLLRGSFRGRGSFFDFDGRGVGSGYVEKRGRYVIYFIELRLHVLDIVIFALVDGVWRSARRSWKGFCDNFP